MASFIEFVLSNFTLTFVAVGLLFSIASIVRQSRSSSVGKSQVLEALFKWFIFFSIGVSYFYNFVMHVFFGKMAAAFIGWADSPFQLEVGFASLGFSIVGFVSVQRNWQRRLCAILGPSFFLLGAAGGHIYQILKTGNMAPGNAGVMLYTDILLPLIGIALLWLTKSDRNDLGKAQSVTE